MTLSRSLRPARFLLLLISSFGCLAAMLSAAPTVMESLAKQNVVWNSPSKNELGSMPIGNGDIGMNVWVEKSGDLVFYISKTDSWNENQTLCKVGKIRVKLTPALVAEGQPFLQTLDLASGRILISGGDTEVVVWVDANNPVIQIDAHSKSGKKITATAAFEMWRKKKRAIQKDEIYQERNGGFVDPDVILPASAQHIGWYHRNTRSSRITSYKLQKIDDMIEKGEDPIINRTFGALLGGDGWKPESDTTLKTSAPASSHSLKIHVRSEITATLEEWLESLRGQAEAIAKMDDAERGEKHAAWWSAFWNRSWLFATRSQGPVPFDLPENAHPWNAGVGSDGKNRYRGGINAARIIAKELSAAEIAKLAAEKPAGGTKLTTEKLTHEITASVWVKPIAGDSGRVLDKITSNTGDGYLLDTFPGLSVRWMVGRKTLTRANCLKAGVWQHIAATANAKTGDMSIYVDGKLIVDNKAPEKPRLTDADLVTRAYTLQRYVNACGGRGAYPIKFNGTIFTVNNVRRGPDYRQWGGGYWLQNTRLPYWSMFESGDFDLLMPLFKFYMSQLETRKVATKNQYGHAGAYFPETMTIWGSHINVNYGFNRKDMPDGLTENRYIRYHWTGGLELITMMLHYDAMTGDKKFREEILLPFATEILTFFDLHWKRNAEGKIHLTPAQSLETFFDVLNPAPEIAALQYNIKRLLPLTADKKLKASWSKILADLPPLPIHTDAKTGKRVLIPAEKYGKASNAENPKLYSLFPFRLFSTTSSPADLEMAKYSYKTRRNRANFGWSQNAIFAAVLGQAEDVRRDIVSRSTGVEPGCRFPVIWKKNYDFVPDQDHGSVLMTAFQYMALQYEDDKILLAPAWPKDWNGHFKLHATKQTTIEATITEGKITELIVTPESRRADVIIPAAFQ